MQIDFAHMCKLSLSKANLFQMEKKNTEEGRKIDFDYIEQICWNTKTNREQCKAQNMHRDWVCPEQVHYSCMICCCLLFQSPFKQPPPFLHMPASLFFLAWSWQDLDIKQSILILKKGKCQFFIAGLIINFRSNSKFWMFDYCYISVY